MALPCREARGAPPGHHGMRRWSLPKPLEERWRRLPISPGRRWRLRPSLFGEVGTTHRAGQRRLRLYGPARWVAPPVPVLKALGGCGCCYYGTCWMHMVGCVEAARRRDSPPHVFAMTSTPGGSHAHTERLLLRDAYHERRLLGVPSQGAPSRERAQCTPPAVSKQFDNK